MSLTTGINPTTVKLADLEVIEAQQSKALEIVEAAPQRPLLTRRDAKQQIIGAMRMINHFSGGDMRQQIDTVEFLSVRVDELETQMDKLREQFEQEKASYRNQIADYKKALRNISVVLDGHIDPFEVKPASKWSKPELGKWIMAVVESMNWARQRADNLLDPVNAVAIAPDPEV